MILVLDTFPASSGAITAPTPSAHSSTGNLWLVATVTTQRAQVIPEPGTLGRLAVAAFPGGGVALRRLRRR